MAGATENTRNTEILTGMLSLMAGLALIATILTRFEFISFFSSYTEDLEYLRDNLYLLQINSGVWLFTALLLTLMASAYIVLLNPFHKMFSWLTGFFLILTAAMLSVSGIKGFSIIQLVRFFDELEVGSNDAMRIMIFTLAREKDIYISISYSILGFAFISLGGFAFRTRRLSIVTGIVCIITGSSLPVLTILAPESLYADIALVAGFITFIIIGLRLLFTGFERKMRKTTLSMKPEFEEGEV